MAISLLLFYRITLFCLFLWGENEREILAVGHKMAGERRFLRKFFVMFPFLFFIFVTMIDKLK